jgi:hypothetical protein
MLSIIFSILYCFLTISFSLLHFNNKELITLQLNLISIHSYIIIVIDQNFLALSCELDCLWLFLVITNYKKILIPFTIVCHQIVYVFPYRFQSTIYNSLFILWILAQCNQFLIEASYRIPEYPLPYILLPASVQ